MNHPDIEYQSDARYELANELGKKCGFEILPVNTAQIIINILNNSPNGEKYKHEFIDEIVKGTMFTLEARNHYIPKEKVEESAQKIPQKLFEAGYATDPDSQIIIATKMFREKLDYIFKRQ